MNRNEDLKQMYQEAVHKNEVLSAKVNNFKNALMRITDERRDVDVMAN